MKKEIKVSHFVLLIFACLIVSSLFITNKAKNLDSVSSSVSSESQLAQVSSQATLALSPSNQTTPANSNFTVNVLLNTGGQAVYGIDINRLRFNPAMLQVVQVTPGSLMPLTIINNYDNNAGTIQFSQVATPGSTFNGSNGIVATITFKAVAVDTSSVTFDFTSGRSTDSNIAGTNGDILSSVSGGSYIGTDSAPPYITITGSTTTLPTGSTSVPLTISTNESSTCKWGKTANTSYASLPNIFSASGNTHTSTITSLVTGTNSIYIRCTDVLGNTNSTDTISTITVQPPTVNATPILGIIGSKSVNENANLTFTINATDTDLDTLTYSATSLPTGATFNNSTRIFSFTPNYTQAGTYTTTFSVSDGKGGTDSEIVTITVANINRSPSANAGNDQTVTLPLSTTLSGSASSDPDLNNLTYAWTKVSGPVSTITSPNTASTNISFTTQGVYTFRLTVSDGTLSSTDNITITVNRATTTTTDGDSDGVLDASDKCNNTPAGINVNAVGCPLPKITTFTTKTDLASVDLNAVSSVEFGNTHGKVTWGQSSSPYVLTRAGNMIDIDTGLKITAGTIDLSSINLPELNKPATITLYNVSIANPQILKDGQICSSCTVVSHQNNTFIFSVTGFSVYSIVSTPPLPPVISSVSSTDITSSKATITWNTDTASDSKVQYGLTSSYGSQSSLTDSVTSHSITLNNLSANTVYHFTVLSKGTSVNPATTTDFTFTTLSVASAQTTDGGGGGGGGGGGNKGLKVTISPATSTIPLTPSGQIAGCGNKTTGFSTTSGAPCSSNRIVNATTKSSYNFGTVTLKNGSRGEAVKELQRFLNAKLNLGLVIDGKLGPKTITVIKKWQKDNNLVPDGLVGRKTKEMMNRQAL